MVQPPQVDSLPIDRVLPRVVEHLQDSQALVLTAPPGAGKTTRLPLALLEAGVGRRGRIVMLQPRRIAARAVARRMAHSLGEPVGRTVGYEVRFDRAHGPETRVLVVTEGILTRRLLRDPFLEGISVVILDEFHERSVHSDLALAFVGELLQVRDDLRLVVMSATLQAGPVVRFLGQCPHVDLEARAHPLQVQYLPRPHQQPLPQQVQVALTGLLHSADDDHGDVLVFLPGVPEIRRTRQYLEDHPLPHQPELVALHGALTAREQDRVLQPGRGRRVILSTNIAETSLTVPGVTAVVDCGLVKLPCHDPRIGMDRLETRPISRSSASQRAGRAGRLAPGRVMRLWTEAHHASLPTEHPPELHRVDLAPVALWVLSFHQADPASFPFFERPADGALQSALSLLRMLGAVEPQTFRLTCRGELLTALPVHPRVGVLLETAQAGGLLDHGALLAALLEERDILLRVDGRQPILPTSDSDLLHRRELFLECAEQGFSPAAARHLGVDRKAVRQVDQARRQLLSLGRRQWPDHAAMEPTDMALRRLILTAFPDRLCRRRSPGQSAAVMVGGRGIKLAEESGVREAELFVALSADAGRPGLHAVSLARMASAVTPADLELLYPDLLREETAAALDPQRLVVMGVRRRYFSDLLLQQTEGLEVDVDQASELLAAAAARRFDQVFRPDRRGLQMISRLRFAVLHLDEEGWPDASEDGLKELLAQLCYGRRSFEELRQIDWAAELSGRLSRRQQGLLQQQVPSQIQVPSGRRHAIDYSEAEATGAPVLAVKLQELFGLARTPCVARGRVPLLLHLLAPNGRPAQVTRDLESFWNGGYQQVRKDLRGRYPKHPWPEDPWSARATAGTNKQGRTR